MIWWIVAAYFAVALVVFISFACWAEPLDGRVWLIVFLAALFSPIAGLMIAFG
ncbi:hypothetical protein [Pelagibacterium lacus]|uniref:hypothetical protein n=1 Tax=Pelagibacterium lacus TaxID=2282655 RepID=UPI001314C483|nr:hypothetical protein [Pelagibacterium lacus]